MSTGNPTFSLPQGEGSNLNAQSREALKDLRLTLEGWQIPEEERRVFVDEFISKVGGKTDEDMIDVILGDTMLRVVKEVRN